MNRATVFVLLTAMVAVAHAEEFSLGRRDLLAKKCESSEDYEYYNAYYLIKTVDITGQGFDACCKKCQNTSGCKKWNANGNGRTSGCQMYKADAPKRKWGGCAPGRLCGHLSGKV